MTTTSVFTLADSSYHATYFDLFHYWLSKQYPEYGHIHTHSDENSGLITASLRFLVDPPIVSDYCIIQDIDVMMFRAHVPAHERCITLMNKFGLECYFNVHVPPLTCPGVHFVTGYWWEKTKEARNRILCNLPVSPAKGYDENVLYQIIANSGLPMPAERVPGLTHGLHLGAFRGAKPPHATGEMLEQIRALFADTTWLDLAAKAAEGSRDMRRILINMHKAVSA